MFVGRINGLLYIRERSIAYADAWLTDAGDLDLWWGAAPDRGVLPAVTAWAGKGELLRSQGVFYVYDWPARLAFQQNSDGTLTFPIPWTRTTATVERCAEPKPRNSIRLSAQLLRFDDRKPPNPEPLARPRATLLWERPAATAIASADQPLSFAPGTRFERAGFAVDLTHPPPDSAVSEIDGQRVAVAHLVVYDDVDHSDQLDHSLVGKSAGRDIVRAISNVAVFWRGPESTPELPPGNSFVDTWPGYQLVTVAPDSRSTRGHTPWIPAGYRRLLPQTAGALPADPDHPLPFTVAIQERAVLHDLPRLFR